jgi:hypothetical protein
MANPTARLHSHGAAQHIGLPFEGIMTKPRVLSIVGHESRIMRTDPWVVVILIIIPGLLLAFFSDSMVGRPGAGSSGHGGAVRLLRALSLGVGCFVLPAILRPREAQELLGLTVHRRARARARRTSPMSLAAADHDPAQISVR